MKLDIPDHDRELLEQWFLKAEPNSDIDALISALENAKPVLRPERLGSQLRDKTSLAPTIVDDLLGLISNLIFTVSRFRDADRARASAIIFSSLAGDVADISVRERFEQRLNRVLSARSVEISGKALGILTDNPKSYCRARIVSEIRPVFSDSDLSPTASVIVHQLKLVYHCGPDHRTDETHIALDGEDLRAIQKVIERAIQKDQVLRALTETMGIGPLSEHQ